MIYPLTTEITVKTNPIENACAPLMLKPYIGRIHKLAMKLIPKPIRMLKDTSISEPSFV